MAVAVISPISNLFFLYLRCCELELVSVGGTDADLLSEAFFFVNEPFYLLERA